MAPDNPAQPGRPGESTDPLIGVLFDDRYRLQRRIARGGMASVYEALDIRLDRVVALKVMHPGMGDDEAFTMRFVREARAAARLSDPNIVAVFDQGEHDGVPFLVMEYVAGATLRERIRAEAPMSPQRALRLLEPILSALAHAHQAGLIHRDVKPENVLITPGGQVKVADFGLAKAVSADTQHTATGGVLIGTVSYLAPELVIDGRSDARADVYAAGILLYELLTGAKPHEGESPIQVAYKHVHADIDDPSRQVPGVPDYVDALVARATARDMDQRPADAGVLLRHVRRVLSALDDGLTSDPELVGDLRPARPPADFGDEGRAPSAPAIVDLSAPGTIRDLPPSPRQGVPPAPLAVGPSDLTTPIPVPVSPFPGTPLDAPELDADPAAEDTAYAEGPGETDRDVRPRSGDTAEHPDLYPLAHSEARLPERVAVVNGEAEEINRAPRRSRKGPVLLLLALIAAVGLGVGAWWFGWERYTITPGIVGMNQASAEQTLAKHGLSARLGEPQYSETEPVGTVLSTDPQAAARVLDGGTVTLILSKGKERYAVPTLAGSTLDEAQDALLATHLVFGNPRERWSEKIPEGTVIASDPEPGVKLKRDTAVDVVVSKGRKPIELRDWTGKRAERAQAWFDEQKLQVTTSEQYDDTVPAGRIISQSPDSGTLYKRDTVTLVVSQGPELVEVPRVLGSGVEAAKQELADAGFEVDVHNSDNYLGLGFVITQDPGQGTMLPKGSTVTIYLV